MIIQCDQCNTRFKLDDAKLARGAAKVRCSKCKHVFVVQKEMAEPVAEPTPAPVPQPEEQPIPESLSPTFDRFAFSDSEFAPAAGQSELPAAGESESSDWGRDTAPEPTFDQASFEVSSDFSTVSFEDVTRDDFPSAEEEPSSADTFEFTPSEPAPSAASLAESEEQFGEEEAPLAASTESFDEFSLGPDLGAQESAAIPPQTAAVDDFAIDFGELAATEDSWGAPTGGAATSPEDHDAMLAGSLGLGVETAETSAVSGQSTDEYELSFGADILDFGGEPSPETEEKAASGDVADFGDLDFGELVTPAPAPVEFSLEPETEAPIAPVATAAPTAPPPVESLIPQADDELPPLSIASRRKSSSLFPAAVVGGAITVVVALAGFGFYFLNGPNSFTRLISGAGSSAEEEGSIAVRKVSAQFMKNKEAGEIFVLRGEAVNSFKKPRASIQIKATLYGANGQPIANKSAYCGNDVTNDQLGALPMAKLDEVMNNQFGDSLANLGVQPGKAIPFVVVFSGVPKDAADYSVQVTGSTVATQ